jgi:hypothetical protein
MRAPGAKQPFFYYLFAVLSGVVTMPAAWALGNFLVNVFGAGRRTTWLFVMPASTFAVFAVAGVIFGFAWPEKSWRWGVWVSLLPFVIISYISPFAVLLLACVVVLPACAGAYVAARVHMKYTRVS